MPLHLCMMVKNEAKIIRRCLESIAPYVSGWIIHDTGSTDGTQQIITDFWAERNIPGIFTEVPWKNFGENRSDLLTAARSLDGYLLLADADYVFSVDPTFSASTLSADAYYLTWEGTLFYKNLKVIKANLPWKYARRTHEYIFLDRPGHPATEQTLDLIRIAEHGDGGNRDSKFQRDLELLALDIAENPADARSTFYMARTLDDMQNNLAAVEWYEKRLKMGGWQEELYYSQYKIGRCLMRDGSLFESFAGELLKASFFDSSRLEAIHSLVSWCRNNQQHFLGFSLGIAHVNSPLPTDRMLFLEPEVYAWRLKDEVSICAFYIGKKTISADLCKRLLESKVLPDKERERVLANLAFSQ